MNTIVNSALDSGTTPAPTSGTSTSSPATQPAATSTAAATTAPPSTSTTSSTAAAPAGTTTAQSFEEKLAATMKKIASHATKVETLKNGAKLYFLANGREVEQAPGKSPYVVAKGTVPAPKTTTPAATTPPSTTPPSTTPPSTTQATPATGSTSGSSGSTTPGK